MGMASVFEFTGALGVGARVADTIRTKIIDISLFENDPALLMLGMVCAVIASSLYLTMATRIGLPVSTTHSIMGGVIGMGIALVGKDGVQWVGKNDGKTGVINGGVVQVFLAWIIAPGLSGAFGAIIFLITKYGVMLRQNPVKKAFFMVPVYFGVTAGLLAMLLIWKGASTRITLTDAGIAGCIIGVAVGWALIIAIFLMPWLHRVVIMEDWQLRWYHIPLGPLLLRRGPVPVPPAGAENTIRDFYEGHLTREELDARRAQEGRDVETVGEAKVENKIAQEGVVSAEGSETGREETIVRPQKKGLIGPRPEGEWYSGPMLFWRFKWLLFRGVDVDVVSMQGRKDLLSGDVEELHANAAHYNNKAEYMYSFLQVMTAATASFTHGANDISNAIGPYATIYEIWNTGVVNSKGTSDVPNWILFVTPCNVYNFDRSDC
jgi:sodium-dependent phosphate transporter